MFKLYSKAHVPFATKEIDANILYNFKSTLQVRDAKSTSPKGTRFSQSVRRTYHSANSSHQLSFTSRLITDSKRSWFALLTGSFTLTLFFLHSPSQTLRNDAKVSPIRDQGTRSIILVLA